MLLSDFSQAKMRTLHSRGLLRTDILDLKEGYGTEISIFKPKNLEDVYSIIDALRQEKLVVADLEGMDKSLAQRSLDFLSGGTCMVDGDLEKVSQTIFLFTPFNVILTPCHKQRESNIATSTLVELGNSGGESMLSDNKHQYAFISSSSMIEQ